MSSESSQPTSIAAERVRLRSVTPDDAALLFDVYASTRSDEIAAWGWDAAQSDSFLRMQFRAQQASYDIEDEATSMNIILLDEVPVGQLIVIRTDDEIQLADIALLTEFRSRGIGSALIENLLSEATGAGKSVRLHVLKTNEAAKHLYERLGFETTGESGMHFQMDWNPKLKPDLT